MAVVAPQLWTALPIFHNVSSDDTTVTESLAMKDDITPLVLFYFRFDRTRARENPFGAAGECRRGLAKHLSWLLANDCKVHVSEDEATSVVESVLGMVMNCPVTMIGKIHQELNKLHQYVDPKFMPTVMVMNDPEKAKSVWESQQYYDNFVEGEDTESFTASHFVNGMKCEYDHPIVEPKWHVTTDDFRMEVEMKRD